MAEREDLRERGPDEAVTRDLEDESPGLSSLDSGTAPESVDLAGLEAERDTAAHQDDGEGGSRFSLGITERIRSRVANWFSTGSFLVAAASTVAGIFLIGGLLPLGSIGDLLGIATASFGYGLASREAHYLENGIAGALVAGTWSLLGNLLLTLFGIGVPVVMLGVAGGGLAGLLGHYFGRDLRNGLTREV